jgi:hypothetical protein
MIEMVRMIIDLSPVDQSFRLVEKTGVDVRRI